LFYKIGKKSLAKSKKIVIIPDVQKYLPALIGWVRDKTSYKDLPCISVIVKFFLVWYSKNMLTKEKMKAKFRSQKEEILYLLQTRKSNVLIMYGFMMVRYSPIYAKR